MRIFVTGGTGFIGQHLVKRLKEEGHSLCLLSRRPPQGRKEFVQGNLDRLQEWSDQVKSFKPEAAIHLAWEGLTKRDYSVATSFKNLKMGLNLYQFLISIGCQEILTSGSCWEYGSQEGKLSEETLIKPANAFPTAKNALCFLGQQLAQEAKVRFIWARIFFVYGPGQHPDSLIPRLIHCGQTDEVMEISDPKTKLDFVYVEDVAKAMVKILKKAKQGGIYNIGSGQLTSLTEVIEIVSQKFDLKSKLKCSIPSHSQSSPDFYADLAKIKREIGWQPKITMVRGIEKTIAFLKE